ncbi:MAG: thioredoxin [Ruminococcaceae bacterium]|nr:thioredoxin [Oscillospiraceae bacterium]
MSIKMLNSANFEQEILNTPGTALVDFYADWCGPCKMVAPIVDEISQELTGITVGKINVDQSPELAIGYNVMSIPTLIIFKNGEEVDRIVGFRPKDAIVEALA